MQGKAGRAALIVAIAGAACGGLLFLPFVQSFLLFILENLKGGVLRRPDLWRGRIRSVALVFLVASAVVAALQLSQKERRRRTVHIILLVCAFIPWLLFPLSARITFLSFFGGLTNEEASDFGRLDSLLYKVLFLSAGLFLLAFLVQNFSFSKKLLKDRQSHTIIFSIILIISFVSFYVGMPEFIRRWRTLWLYTIFDYNDFTLSIWHRGPNGSYPPLANLLTGLFKVFAYAPEWIIEPGSGGYSILSPIGSFLILLFFLTHLLPLMLMCQRAIEGSSLTKAFFSIAICTSSFFIYAIMRGNIILLSVLFTLYYMVFYDSKDERLRKTALLSLAIAANIKIYPAVFGCILIKERRWKDIGRCAAYACLLFFPLFFTYDAGFAQPFGRFMGLLTYAGSDKISAPGPDSVEAIDGSAALVEEGGSPESQGALPESPDQAAKEKNKLIKALTASTFGVYSLSASVSAFTKALQAPRKVYSLLLALTYIIYIGLSVLLLIKGKRKWCLFLVPATACYLIPGMTYCYVPIFLLMPLIALLNEKEKCPAEYGAVIIFLMMFACNWTVWPYVLGYRDFPSLLFTIGLYASAFLTERTLRKETLRPKNL